MQKILLDGKQDPLGEMLLDYLAGESSAEIEVHSEKVEIWAMSGDIMFRNHDEMDSLEQTALSLCHGRILDVGAGSGCHSLYLQEVGKKVEALDISAGCVRVMKERGVKNVIHNSVYSLRGKRYDTLLMLMNGLGICGTISGCNLFFQHVRSILETGGQIIADSTDISYLYGDDFDFSLDNYTGQIDFVMKYQDFVSEPFDWIYLDFLTLETLAALNGFSCELLAKEKGGKYLARIY